MANKKITELTLASPSSSASVVGEDGGVAKRFPVSSFGGGGGIIDVDTLPTENIDASAIYRVKELVKATFEIPSIGASFPITIVDELPETGANQTMYFLTTDQKLHIYLTAEQATENGTTEGWHEYSEVTSMEYVVVESVAEIPEGGMGVVLSYQDNLYYYSSKDATYIKIITSDNFEFDETTGTLVLNL